MPFTYDPTTDRGRVRLLISDVDTADTTRQFFDDAEIDAFLALNTGVKRAAAAALSAMANNALLVDKKIRTQDLQTDAPAVSAELRAQAKALRGEADADADDADDGGLHVIDFDPWAGYAPTGG